MVGAVIGFTGIILIRLRFYGRYGKSYVRGVIAVLAIILRKELLIPVLCGVFLIELVSVMLQVAYFKYTKKKFGEGKEFS